MKIGIQIVLWLASFFFAYQIYDSVNGPIKFNQIKNERYAKVINRLKDIRTAQIAHKDVTGIYSNNFDSLIKFIDEGIFTLIEKRDSSYLEYDRTYRIDMLREVIVIDTLGTVSVKDSLFKSSDRYLSMMDVPNTEGKKVEMQSGFMGEDEDMKIPVFEAKVLKSVILHDQNKDLLSQENEVVSVDGVNGDAIRVGSLVEVNTSGNWPKTYGDSE